MLLECLGMLHMHFPPENEWPKLLEDEMKTFESRLKDRPLTDLLNAPPMTNSQHKLAMQLLSGLWTPCYSLGYQLLLSIVSVKVCILFHSLYRKYI